MKLVVSILREKHFEIHHNEIINLTVGPVTAHIDSITINCFIRSGNVPEYYINSITQYIGDM